MLKSQEHSVKLSELRSELNALAGKETLTDPEVARSAELRSELTTVEERYRAAIALEDKPDEKTVEGESTAEEKEIAQIEARSMLHNYLSAAALGTRIRGAEAELNEIRHADENTVPWSMIAPPAEAEERAATSGPSTSGASQDEILGRVFARTSAAKLGVAFRQVPVGDAVYPVMATGVAPASVAKDAAVDQTAGTFTSHKLSPKRLGASYLFRVEDAATTRGFEEALRRDLSEAIAEAVDKEILKGAGSGFVHELPAAATANAAEEDFASYAKLLAGAIDGRYAHGLKEICCVVGEETLIHAESIWNSGNDNLSAAAYLEFRTAGFVASGLMPNSSANVQTGILYRAGGGMSAVAPMWNAGPSLIRDPYSNSASGQVLVTMFNLWNFKVIREAAYKLVKFRHAV